VRLELKKPIKLGEHGTPIDHLAFRESICAGDLRNLKVSELGDMTVDNLLTLASRLTGQPDVVMNKLELVDLGEVIKIVGGFIEAGMGGSEVSPS